MGGGLDYFGSMDFLEPKCPSCNTVIKYGETTKYDEKKNAHVCLKCNSVLKE